MWCAVHNHTSSVSTMFLASLLLVTLTARSASAWCLFRCEPDVSVTMTLTDREKYSCGETCALLLLGTAAFVARAHTHGRTCACAAHGQPAPTSRSPELLDFFFFFLFSFSFLCVCFLLLFVFGVARLSFVLTTTACASPTVVSVRRPQQPA